MPTGNDFRSSILRKLCPTKTFSLKKFDDVIACDLWFRPPQSKILGTPINGRSPEKIIEDLFFREHLRLCPWSLASSIPVLGLERACPRKGCPWLWPRIFLCPWPWPRALCPRLHLWILLHNNQIYFKIYQLRVVLLRAITVHIFRPNLFSSLVLASNHFSVSCIYFRVRDGFGLIPVGPFTTLVRYILVWN